MVLYFHCFPLSFIYPLFSISMMRLAKVCWMVGTGFFCCFPHQASITDSLFYLRSHGNLEGLQKLHAERYGGGGQCRHARVESHRFGPNANVLAIQVRFLLFGVQSLFSPLLPEYTSTRSLSPFMFPFAGSSSFVAYCVSVWRHCACWISQHRIRTPFQRKQKKRKFEQGEGERCAGAKLFRRSHFC